mmetsp:Transcript_9570/g.28059  ORF Transcript_9570/g.28059 Transcript_9570/m.28059 type:complete len:399 (-) Transcript_9570:1772-2968(-)
MARCVATLLSCCFAAAAATQGVPLEIVLSAVVFDGTATMDLNGPDNDAVQCLRAAIVAVLREEYSSAFVSGVTATSYVADGSTNTKVTFRVADKGINAEYVRDDLLSAVVEPSNSDSKLMLSLGDCWPYDKVDAEAASHVLQTETYRRAGFADVGAVVSSAVVLGGLRAHNFNADEVAITQFGIVIAGALQAATVQIDNIVAEEYKPPSIQDDDDPPVPVLEDDYDEGLTTTIRFDVAIHYWPVGATVLETPEAIAQALKTAISDGSLQSNLDFYAGPQFCASCVLRDATVNVELSYVKIDELTMDEPHAVAAPCTANCGGGGGGDDDDGLDEGEAVAVAIFVILAVVGVAGLIFWLYRSNKLRECCPSEEVEASAGELELDKVSSSAPTPEPQTEMV